METTAATTTIHTITLSDGRVINVRNERGQYNFGIDESVMKAGWMLNEAAAIAEAQRWARSLEADLRWMAR